MSWCEDNPDVFSFVSERDIDFVLLEELRSSEHFRQHFLGPILVKLRACADLSNGSVFHSASRTGEAAGETDLLIELFTTGESAQGKCGILVENKIDAPFSDRVKSGLGQTERYLRERNSNVAAGKWVAGAIVLLAPQAYIDAVGAKANAFDEKISYEAVLAWLDRPDVVGELATRLEHKRQVLRAGLERYRRSWNRTIDTKVAGLWASYHRIATSDFPELRMVYSGGEPSDSYSVPFAWISMEIAGLRRCSAYHVMERGNVDILIGDYAKHIETVEHTIGVYLPKGVTLRSAGKSLGINIKVTPIRRFAGNEAHSAPIREGLEAMRILKSF